MQRVVLFQSRMEARLAYVWAGRTNGTAQPGADYGLHALIAQHILVDEIRVVTAVTGASDIVSAADDSVSVAACFAHLVQDRQQTLQGRQRMPERLSHPQERM